MKKIRKIITMLSLSLMFSGLVCPPVEAAEDNRSVDLPKTAEERMAELRMQDMGPDLSKGILLKEVWGTEEDGTPYVERTYMEETGVKKACHTFAVSRAARDYYLFYKEKSYGATGSVEVTAEFAWSGIEKKAYVRSVAGSFHNGGGVSGISDEQAYPSGNGTEQASATYSVRVHKNLGLGPLTYKVTMTCTYNGKCDGTQIKVV